MKAFIPSLYHPSLTHRAIQLNLENTNDIAIIEYGQYFTKESDIKNNFILSSCSSSSNPRESKNENFYYYINEDGARISVFTEDFLMKKFKGYPYSLKKLIILLKELIDNLKGEKWEAKKYNVLTHNCQNFGAEVIRILKATRKNEDDKIRLKEKILLPSCIISSLWKNEELSLLNALGRIPIFGFFHDFYHNCNSDVDIKDNE